MPPKLINKLDPNWSGGFPQGIGYHVRMVHWSPSKFSVAIVEMFVLLLPSPGLAQAQILLPRGAGRR